MLGILLFILAFSATQVQADSCKKITETLNDLYPEQSKKMITLRLENASDKHKFLRSFIPYYYKRAFKIREELPVYKKLKNHIGIIGGDAHVENFGFIINNNGKAVFTFNDFDDVAEAPLFLDVMRLSQSASYMTEAKQARLLAAYRSGLTKSEYELSDYIKKLGAKAQKHGMLTKAEMTMTSKGPRFAEKQEPFFDTNALEVESMNKILTSKYGKDVKLWDSYRTMKESGGSAFGARFHVLMESQGEMHMVEFKEIMKGGVVHSWVPSKVSESERVIRAQKTLLGPGIDQRIDVVNLNGKPFQIRFKAEGNKSVDPYGAGKKGVHGIIEDEFYLLGQMHRKSLGNSSQKISSYVKDFDGVKTKEWEESVEQMRKEIKKAYDKANK